MNRLNTMSYKNEIAKKIESSVKEENGVKPNIIVLMSESFWDITRVKELGFKEEMFPTYRNLQKTSLTGELLTNVYNGGTVNSEFEAMTGFSVSYLAIRVYAISKMLAT